MNQHRRGLFVAAAAARWPDDSSGLLRDVDLFDALLFGFTAAEAEALDPQTRVLLECAWTAVEAAGVAAPRRVGVFVSAAESRYPVAGPDRGRQADVVAERLGLAGPTLTLPGGDADAHTVLYQACRAILAGHCDAALAGVVDIRPPGGADWPDALHQHGIGGARVVVICRTVAAQRDIEPDHISPLILSAATGTALEALTADLHAHLSAARDASVGRIAHALQGRRPLEHRRVITAATPDQALDGLADAESSHRLGTSRVRRARRVVFLFPGIGDQHPGMARELYDAEPAFRAAIDECLALLDRDVAEEVRTALLVPRESGPASGSEPDLRALLRGRSSSAGLAATVLAQPALFVYEYALVQLLAAHGVTPAAVAGHSLGEYVAACVAGILPLHDALPLVTARARLIADLPRGAMLAVVLDEAAARRFIGPDLDLAAVNGRTDCVVSGAPEAIAELAGRLRAAGIAARAVDAEHAFHSRLMAPVAAELTALAADVSRKAPSILCVCTVTGGWFTDDDAVDPGYWARHLQGTVRFHDAVTTLLAERDHVLLEVGPGATLSSAAKRHPACTRERMDRVLPLLPAPGSARDAFRVALGRLWLAGAVVDWPARRPPPGPDPQLPTYPFERRRHWAVGRAAPSEV